MSFSRQFLVNIFSSWYAHAVKVVIAFFFIPFITSVLGESRYGVWVIILQSVGYFTLMDLSVSAAITRYVSKYLGEKNFDKINRILNTANLFYLGVGIAASAFIIYLANNYFDVFKIDDASSAAEGVTAMSILGIYIGLRFITLPFGSSFVAIHRQDISNILNICEELIRAIALVIILFHHDGLVEMAQVVLVVHAIRQVLSFVILKRLHAEIEFSPALFDWATLKSLFQYSKTAFGISLAWLLIFGSDSVLLGIISSSAAAGIFNPAVQMMYHLRLIVNAIGIPLTPAVSHLETTADYNTISKIYLRGLKYVSYLTFLICTGAILYSPSFISLWLPVSFLPAAEVMQILAVSAAFYLPQILGNSILLGLDKHKYLLLVLLLEVSLKIILAILLIKPYGLIGMAIATAFPQLVLYTTIYPNYVSKVLGISYWKGMRPVLQSGLIATIVTAAAGLTMIYFMPPNTWRTLVINVAVVLLANVIPALLIVEKKDLEKLKGMFRKKSK